MVHPRWGKPVGVWTGRPFLGSRVAARRNGSLTLACVVGTPVRLGRCRQTKAPSQPRWDQARRPLPQLSHRRKACDRRCGPPQPRLAAAPPWSHSVSLPIECSRDKGILHGKYSSIALGLKTTCSSKGQWNGTAGLVKDLHAIARAWRGARRYRLGRSPARKRMWISCRARLQGALTSRPGTCAPDLTGI